MPLGNSPTDLHKDILDNLFDGVYYVDRRRTITYWNRGAERITGYVADDIVGHRCYDNLLQHVDGTGCELCRSHCPLVRAMSSRRAVSCDVYLHHRDGHRVPVSVRAAPITDPDGTLVGAVEIFTENSALEAARVEIETLSRLSSLDDLTQVRNRRAMELSLRSRLHALADGDWPLGVLFLDIDHFKQLNDTHGHDAGDRVLRMVAQTIARSLRPTDVVGRWGGEEFVVLTAADSIEALGSIAERVRMLVESSSLSYGTAHLRVTISVGAALAGAGDTLESIINVTDDAMYRSKSAGRNRVTEVERRSGG